MKRDSADYSHSMKKYDKPIEEEEYAFVKEHFDGFVICPNQHLNGLIGSDNYYQVIATTSVVYASEMNGFIGRGMHDECKFALANGIPVLVLRKNEVGEYITMKVFDVVKSGIPSNQSYAKLII